MIERLLAAERALADGQLDHAERLFAQVAEADERNAIAVVGLAGVARARGDEPAAMELLARALAIDPEEAEAARMLATPGTAAVSAAPADVVAPAEGVEPAEAAAAGQVPPPVGTAAPAASLGARLAAWLRRLVGRGT